MTNCSFRYLFGRSLNISLDKAQKLLMAKTMYRHEQNRDRFLLDVGITRATFASILDRTLKVEDYRRDIAI